MKTLIGVLAGVFVGAMVVEIVYRKNPQLIGSIEAKAKSTVDALVGAFHDGYTPRPEIQGKGT